MIPKKRIVLLGATGSIGNSTLQILRKYPQYFELIGIAAHSQYQNLASIANEFNVPHIALFDPQAYDNAKKSNLFSQDHNLLCGLDGLNQLASLPDADTIVLAIVGTQGLQPALAAIQKGKTIALANKEILVMAGSIITEAAKKHNATIIPLDSEHNAIFQCLQGSSPKSVDRIILTASGGPFRNYSSDQLKKVTLQDALKHPTYNMGPKVTIDSSTLANKGLELIEAHWLFNTPPNKLDVTIHPQSIIHSLVQFIDGSILAQLSPPHMTFPIQYGLLYPHRLPSVQPTLDFSQTLNLELSPPDLQRFPCLNLAKQSLSAGNCAPAIFNASNEVAVDAFINKRIAFTDIPILIDKTLESLSNEPASSLETILQTHQLAIQTANSLLNEL